MVPVLDAVRPLDVPVPPVSPLERLLDVDRLVRPVTLRPVLTVDSEPAGADEVDELPAGFRTLPLPDPPPPKLRAPALVMPPVKLETDG